MGCHPRCAWKLPPLGERPQAYSARDGTPNADPGSGPAGAGLTALPAATMLRFPAHPTERCTMTRRSLWLATLVATFFGTACGAQSGSDQSGSDLVISSDPELARIAGEILPDIAARSGMELTRPVRLEVRTAEELERYILSKLDEDLPAEDAQDRVDLYGLLGLVEPDLDLRALLVELYSEQVAGFYEPDSTAFFIIEGQQEGALRPLLAHELVHAVQDQSADLSALTDPDVGNDRASAAMAVIEGQATLVMLEYMTEQMTGQSVDLADIQNFAEQVRPTLEMTAQFPAMARAPRVIRESLLFPYVEGAIYLHHRWADGDRASPFDTRMPVSTEQILAPEQQPPLKVTIEVAGADTVMTDELGRLELGIFAEDVLGAPDAPFLTGWNGDRFALVEGAGGIRSLVYAVTWDGRADHDDFEARVRSAADALGGPVEVSSTEVDGRVVSILWVGTPAAVQVSLTEPS